MLPSAPDTKVQQWLEQAQRPLSSGSAVKGKVNGVDAVLISPEDAEQLKKAAAAMPEPDIPAGSDLERMLNGEGTVARSIANPLAHGN